MAGHMSTFEMQILPTICVLGTIAAICYGAWASRQLKIEGIRKAAFEEAGEALTSLARIARRAKENHAEYGRHDQAREADRRAYYYDRAAMLVRSIPASRC